jgi:DNA-binding transcriptional LysR family regulator
MHRRYDKNHVPIELLRTLVVIAEVSSFTRAGDLLGLTQSAISAQVKRLQKLVGGTLFDKAGGGHFLNARGKTVNRYAQRILQANDQLLSLSGAQSSTHLVRIGLPAAFTEALLMPLFKACSAAQKDGQLQLHCDHSEELAKSLDGGYLELSILIDANHRDTGMVCEWDEKFTWVCSPALLISPESSIPMVSCPASVVDRNAIASLQRAGQKFHSAFVGTDFTACATAAAAGLGYMIMPERAVPPRLKIARERYLPPAPSIRCGVFLREGIERDEIAPVLRALESVLKPASSEERAADPGTRMLVPQHAAGAY